MSSTLSSGSHQIGADTRLKGSISGSGALTVEGQVDGDVRLDGDLTIATSGVVEGDVDATKLALDGTVRGNVKAREAALGAQSRVTGSVAAPSVRIHPRARVDARLDMPLSLPRQVGSRRR